MLLAVALAFVGNHAFTAAELTAAMNAAGPLDPSAAVDSDEFERAMLLLDSFYTDHGYVTVKIADPEVSGNVVAIQIHEGPKFTISSVTITGDFFGDPKMYLASMASQPGRVFSRHDVQSDDAYLLRYYENRGFAFANITPITHLDVERNTISLELEVERGERAYIESIDIVAPTRELEDRIRRTLPIAVGDMYTSADVDEMKRRAVRAAGVDVVYTISHGTRPTGVKVVLEVQPD